MSGSWKLLVWFALSPERAITAVADWHRKLKASFGSIPKLTKLVVKKPDLAPFGNHFLDVHCATFRIDKALASYLLGSQYESSTKVQATRSRL